MPLRITFDLEDKDLRFFKSAMKAAQATAKDAPEELVIAKAQEEINKVSAQKVPEFVKQRVASLQQLIEMLHDDEWRLEKKERVNVLSALAYFSDPHDMIPDDIPVLGYIDDAIMIELVVIELKHELEAFQDFCEYRKGDKARQRNPNLSREEYLDIKRRELHSRMRRRRTSVRRSRSGSASRTRFRLF